MARIRTLALALVLAACPARAQTTVDIGSHLPSCHGMAVPESETADAGALVNAVLGEATKAALKKLAGTRRMLIWCGLLDDYAEVEAPPDRYVTYRLRIILWEERDRLLELSVPTDRVAIAGAHAHLPIEAMRLAWRSVFAKPPSAWTITSFSREIPVR